MEIKKEGGSQCLICIPWEYGGKYIKEALLAGCCGCYLPVRFLEERGRLSGYYDETGFLPLAEYLEQEKERSGTVTAPVVRVVRQLAELEKIGQDYLLGLEKAVVCLRTVYVRPEEDRVSIAYVPGKEELSFSQQISQLLKELEMEYGEEGISLISKRYEGERERRRLGLSEIHLLFGRWEREL